MQIKGHPLLFSSDEELVDLSLPSSFYLRNSCFLQTTLTLTEFKASIGSKRPTTASASISSAHSLVMYLTQPECAKNILQNEVPSDCYLENNKKSTENDSDGKI